MLANGAECEPLLHKDYELMLNHPEEIISGMKLMIDATSAGKGYFGIKEKNAKAIDAIRNCIGNSNIEMSLLGDFYPSGDEYELVYHATKRLIPPHGIPLDIGCVVNNVETLYNINNAQNDIPVTQKFITVAGAVKNPSSFFVPVGMSFREIIDYAGGTTVSDYAIFVSGLLMGTLTFDLNEVVTKTTAGIIILPKNHYMVQRQKRDNNSMNRIGKSACDQCSYCTEFCPRYLLGYDVQPHKVMRSLVFTTSGRELWNQYADLCCECGLCSLYACPEDLYPREACQQSKDEMRQAGFKYEQPNPVKVHPIKSGRRVPLKNLMKKLNVERYNVETPFRNDPPDTNTVLIKLKQHAGQSAVPAVKLNQKLIKGELIGEIPVNALGANVHASISGVVTEVTDDYVRISKN
jgi:Na+-translocating ferredoxin:NAD+ oxidoreductase RnfC subunit